MKRLAALLAIAVAFGAMFLTSAAGARDVQEGPVEIEQCRTIDKPGSYRLVNNLVASTHDCLVITADFVTIDLAGFSITGLAFGPRGLGILALPSSSTAPLRGIAVRNGSLSALGVDLGSANGSIVEGLRVFGVPPVGIIANGIVKGNIVVGAGIGAGAGPAVITTGIVTGNYVTGSRKTGIFIGEGSTVIGNTATNNLGTGIEVSCPSNVTDNTAVNNGGAVPPPNNTNLLLHGDGCHSEDNVAP
jgi:hypothetical protein